MCLPHSHFLFIESNQSHIIHVMDQQDVLWNAKVIKVPSRLDHGIVLDHWFR